MRPERRTALIGSAAARQSRLRAISVAKRDSARPSSTKLGRALGLE